MMIDTDLFIEWIEVPDDPPVLTPVDEEVPIWGLNDIATLTQSQADFDDQTYETNSGLLLGCQPVDGVDMIIPHSGTNASFSMFNSSPSHVSYSSLCPPALSPDSSPSSIASTTPWLRTPILENMGNLNSANVLWNVMDRETCSTINLVDQAGNSLEDISSQVQDIMPENIACSPEIMLANTCLPPHNTPSFTISPSYCVSAPQAEVVQLGPPNCLSLTPSSQSLFSFSPVTSASPSLSPLSTLSFFSPSPSVSTNPLPLIDYSSISPAFLPMSLSDSDSDQLEVEGTDSIRLRGKRSFRALGDDQVPRRSNAKNDDDEWDPESERIKRTRVVAISHPTIPNFLPDSSTREENQDTTGTHTCCEFCGQRFTRPSDYIRHIENSANHPETRKVWPCPYCDSPLGRKDALGRHIRTIHPGKPVFIPEGILGSRLPGSQKDPSVQRMGLRKNSSKRQLRKDTRRSR